MLTLREKIARLPITCDPEVQSGATVFHGTRVPVVALMDNLAAGLSLDEFLENFPTVQREQAIQVLEFFKEIFHARGSREKFLQALSKVPDTEPEEQDRIE